MKNKKKLIRIIFAALGGLTVLVIAVISAYMLWEEAPAVQAQATPPAQTSPLARDAAPAPTATPDKTDRGVPFDTKRKDGVYTILLVGNDDGNGNTDTIMAGKIDAVRHTMSFVSIPRDTLINVDWNVRKLNSVYWGAANSGASGIDALLGHVKKLVGFDIDCYAVLDLDAFVEAVDAMGGIYFDVPEPICYEDYWQGLYLDIDSGYQLLDGYQSMCLCRYRSGYITGDLGRIEMQHKFLKAAAEQFIGLGSVPNITKVVEILSDSMDTNLTASNIAYFIRQALMCRSEDVSFYTAPNTPAMAHGYSYAFLNLHDWVDMVNERLNPYAEPITEGNLDVVYLMNGSAHCTTALKGIWYYDFGSGQGQAEALSGGNAGEGTQESEPEKVEEEPEQTAAPADSGTAETDGGVSEMQIWPYLPELSPAPTPTPAADDWLSCEDGTSIL